MKIFSAICFLFVLSCTSETREVQVVAADTSLASKTISQDHSEDSFSEFEYATFYLVIADTGSDYYKLRSKMMIISGRLNIPVDTMGRYYDVKKDLIALPENDEDEMYAGNYFPRRFPSEHLSLEYLDFYKNGSGEKTIALVSGIFDNEMAADKSLAAQKRFNENSFKLKATVYTGCMH